MHEIFVSFILNRFQCLQALPVFEEPRAVLLPNRKMVDPKRVSWFARAQQT
jgi:hypothetical protein